ncbi:MAG: putative lipid II flippase FtsW [Planctomycetes bacterium]|nr:putative lipid II flippase FtsW [Planctomycetota bacterium]
MHKSLHNLYLLNVLALVGIGAVMVFSSSAIAELPGSDADPFLFIKRHGMFLLFGLVSMLAISRMDHTRLQTLAKPLYIFGLALLVVTLLPGIGTSYNGARRWLRFGGVGFQTTDFAKIALLIAAAAFAVARKDKLGTFKQGFIPACGFVGVYAVLSMAQPDLGTSIFLMVSSFVVLLAGGLRGRHLLLVLLIILPLAGGVMFTKFDHVKQRVLTFMDPEYDPQGKGHQVRQSLIAVGSGGLDGQGLGQSRQKLFYLPEQETDFIFAVLSEELGFVGSAFTLVLFGTLMLLGVAVAARAPDRFGSLLALGVTAAIGIQACMNVAVVTASVPTKGIGLPFISFGGSACFFYLTGVGVVLSVARRAVGAKQANQLGIDESMAAESDRVAATPPCAIAAKPVAAVA